MPTEPKVLVIIPARWSSSRFPGKPLAKIAGITMIQRVVAQADKAKCVSEVIVATDDSRILEFVNSAGARAIMIGIALGTIAQSFRIMTGRERSILGD